MTVSLGDFDVSDFERYLSNMFYDLDGMDTFYFVVDSANAVSQTALELIYNAVYAYQNSGNLSELSSVVKTAEEELANAKSALETAKNELYEIQEALKAFEDYISKLKSASNDFNELRDELLSGLDAKQNGSLSVIENNLSILKTQLSSFSEFDKILSQIDALQANITADTNIDNFNSSIISNLNSLSSLIDKLNDTTSAEHANIRFAFAALQLNTEGIEFEEGALDQGQVLITSGNISVSLLEDFVNAGLITKKDLLGFLTDEDKKKIVESIITGLDDTTLETYAKELGYDPEKNKDTTYSQFILNDSNSFWEKYVANDTNVNNVFSIAINNGVFASSSNWNTIQTTLFDKIKSNEYSASNNEYVLKIKNKLLDGLEGDNETILKERFGSFVSLLETTDESISLANAKIDEMNECYAVKNGAVDSKVLEICETYGGLTGNITSSDVLNAESTIRNKIQSTETAKKSEVSSKESAVTDAQQAFNDAKSNLVTAEGDWTDLLNLALRYNTSDWTGYKITQITRTKDSEGNYVYSVTNSESVAQVGDKVLTSEKALSHLSLPYYVLAVCLEKSHVILDVMTEQINAIAEINDEIEKNNEYLKKANQLYESYYNCCISSSGGTYNFDNSDFDSYVKDTCGYSVFTSQGYRYHVYNTEGGTGSGDYQNIDVEEQGNLTKISNAQEAIRMYGDKLSTESQMATTNLQQYTQNYNTTISICSQLAKSTGEYFKTITSNIR